MTKILLATDGSSFSLRAADYVANLFRDRDGAEVTVLYVEDIHPMLLSPIASASLPDAPIPTAQINETMQAIKEQMERERKTILESTMERFATFGERAASRAAEGKAGDVICDIAEQENFDLVVVGSSGKGRVKRALLGSVSYKVVNHVKASVLVVRGKG